MLVALAIRPGINREQIMWGERVRSKSSHPAHLAFDLHKGRLKVRRIWSPTRDFFSQVAVVNMGLIAPIT